MATSPMPGQSRWCTTRGQRRCGSRRSGWVQAWTPYGNTPVLFTNGDELGACAKANGEVRVYKNDTLIKTVTLSTTDQKFFNAKGGKVESGRRLPHKRSLTISVGQPLRHNEVVCFDSRDPL